MSRSLSYSALCLRVRPSGESNREAWFLTGEEGILKITVFGGPKSRFRSQAAAFNQGRIWIYHDPVRDSRKLTDFDVRQWRPGLRELYERTMAADAVVETILATHGGGGNWKEALDLAGDFLDCLENANEKVCKRLLLHFLWAWTGFLGVRPDMNYCSSCACELPPDGVLWMDSLSKGNLYCENCRSGDDHRNGDETIMGLGARRWLLAVQNLKPPEAQRYNLDNSSFRQARFLVLDILEEALGRRLSLWDELEV
jgi:DNA repair protein RecO (recombination protein O)